MVLFGGTIATMYLIALLFLLVFDALREGVLRILPMFYLIDDFILYWYSMHVITIWEQVYF